MDTFGNTYDSTTKVDVFYDQGDSELSVIGRQLDAFLSQVSYVRNGGTVYMGSVTQEESDDIDAFLSTCREANRENKYVYLEALTSEEFDVVDTFLYTYREASRKNKYMYMEALALEELDAVNGFLYSYRKKDKELNEPAVESDQLDGQISLF